MGNHEGEKLDDGRGREDNDGRRKTTWRKSWMVGGRLHGRKAVFVPLKSEPEPLFFSKFPLCSSQLLPLSPVDWNWFARDPD